MKRREALSLLTIGAAGALLPWHGAQAQGTTLRGYARTNWSRDPYSFGSYSYVAKNARQRDCAQLAAPIDNRVYFAGEAAHPTQISTVNAAYSSGRTAAKQIAKGTSQNIAIIGAGISGLAAAEALASQGRSVTIFEAQSRIGGRIWTDNSLGMPLDMGASWIHGTQGNPLTKLARQANAKTTATGDSYIIRGAGGRRIKERNEPEWLENVITIQHDAGADSSQLNLRDYHAQEEYSGKEVIFPHGYVGILKALRGDYEVNTSEKVTMISHGDFGVEITSTKRRSTFDAVIVTLPLGVLKREVVKFRPALPRAKRQAISRLGMGTLDKLYMLYDKPFWDADTTWIATPENGLPQGYFNQWLNLYKYIGQPLLVAFNGGPPALELAALSDKKLVQFAQQTLHSAYP